MLFNSLTFVVFFALVTTLYWAIRSWEWRKNLLLLASYLFYGAWNPPFVLLLFATSFLDFQLGARIAASRTASARKAWLVASVLSNLTILVYFKYGNFLLENFEWFVNGLGIPYHAPRHDIILPIGISFYTFHSLSYTLDVFRGATRPTSSLRDFLLAVSFFPQLVAGPIVRASDFLPQCKVPLRFHVGHMRWGLFLLTLGLFEKVVLADTALSGASDKIFRFQGPLAPLDAWMGAFAFSGQAYFDFAGYSLCAIGSALCLGFHLKDNFRSPYGAIGFSDFWKRWHISLSTFLRDYLYIPLGGSRLGTTRKATNLFLVMFIVGLWHGAGWTFVVWGMVHGMFLVAELGIRFLFQGIRLNPIAGFFLMISTFLALCVPNVIFRSPDFATAGRVLLAMGGRNNLTNAVLTGAEIFQVVTVVAGMLAAHWFMRDRSFEGLFERLPRWSLAGLWVVMIFLLILNQGNGNAFIYFQF